MSSQEIRRSFLKYFESQSHKLVPSAPVIPHDDPTLLFNNAGMNQFKDVFLGKSKREYTRATTTQKCIRAGGKHNDLENVGHTSRHLSFFEMLGNFSFGDYFKKEAIAFAWDVSTHIFGFDPEKIWPTVYKDDDEAFALWEKHVPTNRIVRFGEEENFWAMGDVGPCGPCSELLYDRGKSYSDATSPIYDITGERFLEFWNLVFMQFSKDSSGKMSDLPSPCIDTGAGLERIVALSMDVDSVFLTDILRGLIAEMENISGIKYDVKDSILAPAFQVIADHIRALCFAIADGAQPSNVDRGYVLRKILRRASRYGRKIGLHKPFLAKLLPRLISLMGEDFPEIGLSEHRIGEILTLEEEAFIRTLEKGGNLLNQVIESTKEEIKGEDAFKLKDTYGFPIEEILLLAKDAHLKVDLKKFNQLEEEAKERSRGSAKKQSQQFEENFFKDFSKTHPSCDFLGHTKVDLIGNISAMIFENRFVDSLEEGQEGMILLNKTPFYAEMGGQVGDTGFILKSGASFEVTDTISPYEGVIAHIGLVTKGSFKKQDKINAQVNIERRKNICNNHTTTHLLHWALSKVLGEHIKQAGSVVDPFRLRFDFSHHKALSEKEIFEIEELINEKIRTNEPVQSYEISYEKAQKDEKIKQFFGEKYGEKVRVIDMDFSKELCGGTHTTSLGSIGFFKIAKEMSIAAGIRRIEAVTGKKAEEYVREKQDLLLQIAKDLKTHENKILPSLHSLIEENRSKEQLIKKQMKERVDRLVTQISSKIQKIKNLSYLAEEVDLPSSELIAFAEKLMNKVLLSGLIVLATKEQNRCQLVIKVSKDLIEKGIFANDLIKKLAPIIQGGGGGKKDLAQAGGKDVTKIQEALLLVPKLLEEKC